MEIYKVIVVCFLQFFSFIPIFTALDSITPNQPLHYNETLISKTGTFEAGFFSFENSQSQYFGIWFNRISPRIFVWVANRDTPLENSSGVFKITEKGNLFILDGNGAIVWSSNSSTAENPVVQLLDSANLVVKDGNNSNPDRDSLLWQSFDYPGDTLLPGMKLKSNLVTGQYRALTSWRSTEDPAPGQFSLHIDTHGLPQEIMTKGKIISSRIGSWNGIHFTGVPWLKRQQFLNFSFVLTEQEVSYEYGLLNSSTVTRYFLNPTGLVQRFFWSERTQTWDLYSVGPVDQCESYAICGANANCNVNNSPLCECLKGFLPKFQEKWSSYNWSDGCIRRINLGCDNGDGFMKYSGMKLPDTSSSRFNKSITLEECKKLCFKNCSCSVYADLDVRNGGSGCLLWFGDIVDMRKHATAGQDIYIRVAASELDHTSNSRHFNKKRLAVILVGSSISIIGITILGFVLCVWRKKLENPGILKLIYGKNKKEKQDINLPAFDFSIIANATNQFSASNKLGEGGFGAVYKGVLANVQEIAVKRLSQNSGQGPEEFKNEAMLITNLQHRNLVKLLGFCIKDDERLLIYEFMTNRSLDYFIFDQNRTNSLNWAQRFQIISGIVRGLLYLHQDSRLKIIHRDLKTSNILLDKDMNPKISDFGLARIIGGDQAQANTKKVVGTHGYMSPEYAMHGSFSVKSDVFSFGVIVLEIVSGRKNIEFFVPYDHNINLLGFVSSRVTLLHDGLSSIINILSKFTIHCEFKLNFNFHVLQAWELWNEGRPLELLYVSEGDSLIANELLRCIQIGLLCVQQRPEDRPDMSSVVLMLNGDRPLPKPREPPFHSHQFGSSGNCALHSKNEITFTSLEAR